MGTSSTRPDVPKEAFAQGPRQKYVDIVTDTLHASSSDLITWNTLVMMKLNWIENIPRQWIEITTQSLEAWKTKDEVSPFLPDNRRGYARVTPVALSKIGVPNSGVLALDQYPGLGLYENFESWEQYTGYIWSTWTTKEAQAVHVDSALQAMIDQSLQMDSSQAGHMYSVGAPSSSSMMIEFKGSYVSSSFVTPPFPDSMEDVSMEASADKRSRESPDSTIKPEGKSLKTSGVATAATAEPAVSSACAADTTATNEGDDDAIEIPTIRWKVKELPETRLLMRQLHRRMPAWKLKARAEALRASPVDLSAIAETTGVQFATEELVDVAAKCLDEVASEMAKEDTCFLVSQQQRFRI